MLPQGTGGRWGSHRQGSCSAPVLRATGAEECGTAQELTGHGCLPTATKPPATPRPWLPSPSGQAPMRPELQQGQCSAGQSPSRGPAVDRWGFQPRKRKATGRRAVRVHENWQRGPRAVGKGKGGHWLGSLAGLQLGERRHFLDDRIVQKQTRSFCEGVSCLSTLQLQELADAAALGHKEGWVPPGEAGGPRCPRPKVTLYLWGLGPACTPTLEPRFCRC